MRRIAALGACAALASCTSYKADVTTICDSPMASHVESPSVATKTKAEKITFMFEWSAQNIHTPEGKALLKNLADAPVAEKAPLIRASAASSGVGRCGLAEWLERTKD